MEGADSSPRAAAVSHRTERLPEVSRTSSREDGRCPSLGSSGGPGLAEAALLRDTRLPRRKHKRWSPSALPDLSPRANEWEAAFVPSSSDRRGQQWP